MYIGDWVEEQKGYYLGNFENKQIFVCHQYLQKTDVTWDEAMNANVTNFHLPSKEESNFIHTQITDFNLFKKLGIEYGEYWTRTDSSSNAANAWIQNMIGGYPYTVPKNYRHTARFIRKVFN